MIANIKNDVRTSVDHIKWPCKCDKNFLRPETAAKHNRGISFTKAQNKMNFNSAKVKSPRDKFTD